MTFAKYGRHLPLQDVRVIRLWFGTSEYAFDKSQTPKRILWDHERMWKDGSQTILMASLSPPRIPFYPDCRPCYYVPLTFGSAYTSALTVYVDKFSESDQTIKGIVSHGPTSRILGRREGTPLHFVLAQGEYLTSAWLTLRKSRPMCRTDSFLSVTTNYKRQADFGRASVTAYDASSYIGYASECLGSRQHRSKITGFIVDALTYLAQNTVLDIGVTEIRRKKQIGKPPSLWLSYALPPVGTEFIRSLAKLDDNICKVQVQTEGPWYVGMLLTRSDGPGCTLGRWDPFDKTSTTIFEAGRDGPLTGMVFHMSWAEGKTAVRIGRITAVVTPNFEDHETDEHPHSTIFFSCQKREDIVWWFGYGRRFCCGSNWDIVTRWRSQGYKYRNVSHGIYPLVTLHG
ncbi:hypothetical protein VTK73DRAFT_5936 [Phialemonium thermophilum]|uniref:Uncharacterized protein n=1 Tax=Phialemonium thermophilum TaxID=223376 RepID=A0ABR3WLB1_9PEZI